MKSKRAVTRSRRTGWLRRNPQQVLARRKVKSSRPVHKRVLLHPVTVLVLLCVGVFIIGWTYQVIADNFTVSAVVPAASLEQGAMITYPADGAILTQTPTIVRGLCPQNSYVKLYDNGLFSGVDICSSAGTFQIEIDLFNGQNVLLAKDFNITDQQGPVTPSITVTYQPKQPATNPPVNHKTGGSTYTNKAGVSPEVPPLLLISDFHYQTSVIGRNFSWAIGIQGGVPPYAVTIQWGDGQTSTATYQKPVVFQITHKYSRQGYYVVKVDATDAGGNHRLLQLAALVKLFGAPGIVSAGVSASATPAKQNVLIALIALLADTQGWLWVAWPSFIIVVLMIVSFWLGERKEYQDILKRQRHWRHQTSHR